MERLLYSLLSKPCEEGISSVTRMKSSFQEQSVHLFVILKKTNEVMLSWDACRSSIVKSNTTAQWGSKNGV